MRIAPLAGTSAIVGGAVAARALRRRREQVATRALRGQVAAITGGSRGLGLLLARELARHGCRLAICARDERELDRAARDLQGRGAEVVTIVCDVADRRQAEGFVAAVTERFGRVDLLVNNAGIIQVGPVRSLDAATFEDAMGVMFFGALYPTLAVLPQMRARGQGRIVNITSIAGKVSVPHLLPYNAAKFAAVGFSEGLHAEVSPDGVSVTTVVPGLMRTGSHLNALFSGDHEAEFAWFALGASLPLVSMDAERAAQRIVSAAARGRTEVILTPQAQLGARMQALFPSATARVVSLGGRLLPSDHRREGAGRVGVRAGRGAASPTTLRRGREINERRPSTALDQLTRLGRRAAARFNQLPGVPRPRQP